MSRALTPTNDELPALLSDFQEVVTPEEFEKLCLENRDLRLELTSTGDLIVMPPAGSMTGLRNANLTHQLATWAEKAGTGVYFDSSTGFALPNNARRSPDAAWVDRKKWNLLTQGEKEGFAPICPDFVVELRSRNDRLAALQRKMQEYILNGSKMAWLIDPLKRRVHVYRIDRPVVILDNPEVVSGDPVLPGFKLKLTELW